MSRQRAFAAAVPPMVIRRLGAAILSVLVLTLAGLLLTTGAAPAYAHASVVRSEPPQNAVLERSPARVAAWFSETLHPDFSAIRVLDVGGQQVDNGDSYVLADDPQAMAATLPPLEDGMYTVVWRTLSGTDGHTMRGSFVFFVGEAALSQAASAPATPLLQSPLDPVVRWVVLLAALAATGGLAFNLLVVRPALRAVRLTGVFPGTARRLGLGVGRGVLSAGLLLLGASLVQLVVQASVIHDVSAWRAMSGPAWTTLNDTNWGHYWLMRVGLLAVFLLLVSVDMRRLASDASSRGPVSWLALGVGCAMLLPMSLTSHMAAVPGLRLEGLSTDFLHFLAAAVWVGGLFHFALAFPALAGGVTAEERRQLLGEMVPRFSALALLSAGTLAITGVFSFWAQVGSLEGMATPYGGALGAKLLLLLPIGVLGAVNFLWVRGRLSLGDGGAWRWLRRFVVAEALVAVLIVGAVGWMTGLEPGRQAAARGAAPEPTALVLSQQVEGADVSLRVEPGTIGRNHVLVGLRDGRGNPIEDASRVGVRVFYLDGEIIEHMAFGIVHGAGLYAVDNVLLNLSGNWEAEVTVQRRGGFDIRTSFQFELSPEAQAVPLVTVERDPATGRLLWTGQMAALGLMVLAVVGPASWKWSGSRLPCLLSLRGVRRHKTGGYPEGPL